MKKSTGRADKKREGIEKESERRRDGRREGGDMGREGLGEGGETGGNTHLQHFVANMC